MSTSQVVGYRFSQFGLLVVLSTVSLTVFYQLFYQLFGYSLLAPFSDLSDPSASILSRISPIISSAVAFLVIFVLGWPQGGTKWIHDSLRFFRAGFFYGLIILPLVFTIWHLNSSDILQWHTVFLTLAVLKGFKILVDGFSYWVLSVDIIHSGPATVLPRHVTVIIPTTGQIDEEFEDQVESIYANSPGQIIISTKGLDRLTKAKKLAKNINEKHFDEGRVIAMAMAQPNKRAHFIKAANVTKTRIIAHVEDNVVWPEHFLKHALAPFEDREVGLVGIVRSSNRDYSGGISASIRNYIACLRTEQENFENTASYNIDGGVFNISGRTSLMRTEIIHSIAFRQGFLGERFHLPLSSFLSWIPLIGGWLGQKTPPMVADGDNFITRHVVNQGYKTVFLNPSNDDVRIRETHTKNATKDQIKTWARTEQRHTLTSLFVDRTIWYAHPWTTFTVFLPRLFPLNIIFDPLLIISLYLSTENIRITLVGLGVLYVMKLTKAMLVFSIVGGWFLGSIYCFASPILELYEAFAGLFASFGICKTDEVKEEVTALLAVSGMAEKKSQEMVADDTAELEEVEEIEEIEETQDAAADEEVDMAAVPIPGESSPTRPRASARTLASPTGSVTSSRSVRIPSGRSLPSPTGSRASARSLPLPTGATAGARALPSPTEPFFIARRVPSPTGSFYSARSQQNADEKADEDKTDEVETEDAAKSPGVLAWIKAFGVSAVNGVRHPIREVWGMVSIVFGGARDAVEVVAANINSKE